MTQFLHTKTRKGVGEVLLLGKQGFSTSIPFYHSPPGRLHCREMNSAFKAFQWLQKGLDAPQDYSLPKAIVVDYDFLQEDKFMLLESINQNLQLKAIPFLVYTDNPGKIDRVKALKRGIDDFFTVPTNSDSLENRIRFLAQFKPVILNSSQTDEIESFTYEIPFSKRVLDIVLASIVIFCISPILLLLALAVRLESKGPIIYRSKRVGTGYQVFDFLKFRSMYKDADQRLKDLQHLNQYAENDTENCFVKINNDPRVTRVGRFIRKYSLDELPQLFNVIKGDMSLVGNRPLPLYEAEQITRDEWAERFLAPAGMTGLWQVTKRGTNDMSTQERVNLDVTYAQNYSFWYDLKIMLKTIPAMVQKEDV